jgi:hypothetical protein
VKFIFSDALDLIDPQFDFRADRSLPGRRPYWDDVYPHEYLEKVPYDGILVSRAIVGDAKIGGKYSTSQLMRFRREGARRFLRIDKASLRHLECFGDCGAFSYVREYEPPYRTDDTVAFYQDGGFSHGCSVDHVIFEFDPKAQGIKGGSADARRRFDITLENAAAFLRASKQLGKVFTPLGVVQGWSPDSKGEAASRLQKMGYRYLAVGGLVPLNVKEIHLCLSAIRERIASTTRLHLLGFAKADHIHEFQRYGVASFDSSSPLIRAFKDARSNYYLPNGGKTLKYYTALRIPQAIENARLMRKAKAGHVVQEELLRLEANALSTLRRYANGKATRRATLEAVLEYNAHLASQDSRTSAEGLAPRYEQTLRDAPWKQCRCRVCRESGVEVMIFRSSNRNKRRGFHNLAVYYDHLQKTVNDAKKHSNTKTDISRYLRAAA